MSLEARKVQRLGSSSLVVTLPKSWVRRVNLKQGDVVYVVDEGATLRIVPRSLVEGSRESERAEVELDKVARAGVKLRELLTCMYVAGFNVVRIKGAVDPSELDIADRWAALVGLEVLYDTEGVTVKCLADVERLSSRELAKALAGLAERLKLSAEEGTSGRRVRDLKGLVTCHVHAVNRKLALRPSFATSRWEVPSLVSLGLLGLALHSALSLAEECEEVKCTSAAYGALADAAECAYLVALSLAERKLHMAARAHECARRLKEVMEQDLLAKDPYAAGRLRGVLDAIEASARIALCVALAEKLEGERQ